MTPVELSRTVLHAVRRAVDEGELRVSVPERAVVTVPGPGGCGDYATNIALQLARPAGQPPRRVAEVLRSHLVRADGVTGVEITGPGFLNISLDRAGAAHLVCRILRDGLRYGHSDALAGQTVRLRVPDEIRARVVADAVTRLVASQGGHAEVMVMGRGDADPQEHTDLRPVPAPADPTPLGPDAARWALLHPAQHDRPRIGDEHLVQRESNPLFRVRYAHARTRALHRNAADLGFDSRPDALGADEPVPPQLLTDHLGADEPLPSQLLSAEEPLPPQLLGADEPVPPQLLSDESVPPPLLTGHLSDDQPAPSQLLTGHLSDDQPAPSRLLADHLSDDQPLPPQHPGNDEPPLLRLLADHPRILTAAATHRAPDRLARHLVTVADAVLPFLPTVLPRGAEKPSAAHRARLALAEAAGTVLAGGLSLLGIDAPDHL